MEFVGETADFPQEEILWRNQAISSVLDAVGDVRGWDVTVRNVFKWPAIPDWGRSWGFTWARRAITTVLLLPQFRDYNAWLSLSWYGNK